MTPQEIDRIECAIRHIQTATDVDPWAAKIAVEAMEKQIPKKPKYRYWFGEAGRWEGVCPTCGQMNNSDYDDCCGGCGQRIDWTEDNP